MDDLVVTVNRRYLFHNMAVFQIPLSILRIALQMAYIDRTTIFSNVRNATIPCPGNFSVRWSKNVIMMQPGLNILATSTKT